MKQTLISILMVIALTVFYINLTGAAPWWLVAGYWAVLTIKNAVDYWEGRNKKE